MKERSRAGREPRRVRRLLARFLHVHRSEADPSRCSSFCPGHHSTRSRIARRVEAALRRRGEGGGVQEGVLDVVRRVDEWRGIGVLHAAVVIQRRGGVGAGEETLLALLPVHRQHDVVPLLLLRLLSTTTWIR